MRSAFAVGGLFLFLSLSGCFGGGDNANEKASSMDHVAAASAPGLNLSATPLAGTLPLELSFVLTLDDADGDALSWTLDADGDGASDAQGNTSLRRDAGGNVSYSVPTVNFTFADAGTFTSTATASDGNATATTSIIVTVSSLPPIDRAHGDTRVFAAPPDSVYLEGLVVGGGRVFAGTISGGLPVAPVTNLDEPSRIYVWDTDGAHLDTIVVAGEDVQGLHGLGGLSLDGAGRLYATSVDGRILRFTEASDGWMQETYATFPDLPACSAPGASSPCAMTRYDGTPLPNDMIWDGAGNMYVTDTQQALIWMIPPGPGAPTVWYQHEDLQRPFSVNGLRIHPDGDRMVFVTTGPDNLPEGAGDQESRVFTVPFPDPGSEAPTVVHALPYDHCADGITYGASGLLYVLSLCGSTLFVIDDGWNVVDSIQDPLMEYTASLAFDDVGRRLLITNYAIFTGEVTPEKRNVIDVFVDDTAAATARPIVP